MQFTQAHLSITGLSKSVLCRVPNKGKSKKVYLTFNDGPNPQLTPWVAEQLKSAGGLKATFFCVGDHAEQHPEIVKMLKDEGTRWQTTAKATRKWLVYSSEVIFQKLS